ncbi:DMT family transporter [Paracraurococcus ruber]|uniref:EamA domain-containing protein n=1 Tax=Paracraurococcus ruber TaxID=77675 RepID=A0ABS1CUB6_9PROT|nr:DMT family transporter [Paracraurococcus ruber]MBK1658088.1 hypothetical protein [Paracraurococcus ruber]TDG32341.1 DMT family transporter [Paracraurococcus ruber]
MAGLGLGLLFVAIWASAFTAARVVVLDWPALWGLAARFALVMPVLLAILAWRGAAWPGRGDAARLAAMGLLGTGLYLAATWEASTHLPSGLVALLAATAPLFVAVGEAALLRQRIPPRAWAGLALGWLGVAILGAGRGAGDALTGAAPGTALGVALALGGALCQAGGLLAFAPARRRLDPWLANAAQTGVAAATLLVLAAAVEPALPGPPGPAVLAGLAWSVLLVGVGGYALYFVMLERLPPATAAALQLLAPPVAALFGWALLGERLAASDLMGGAVTLGGLWLLLGARR